MFTRGHERELYAQGYPTGWRWPGEVPAPPPEVPPFGSWLVVRPVPTGFPLDLGAHTRWFVPPDVLFTAFGSIVVVPPEPLVLDRGAITRWFDPTSVVVEVPPFGTMVILRPGVPHRELDALLHYFVPPDVAVPTIPRGQQLIVLHLVDVG